MALLKNLGKIQMLKNFIWECQRTEEALLRIPSHTVEEKGGCNK